eukprot:CAMPEP_0182528398 /NCGR_PEP_ID=MMETSP1323-20130603/4488_1 /TAXON_ID=236787 /ORGANISM="Florenciella parvula, Strain RCC1693" /LENGTH=100 /DNA_ID=CAMNT_0024737511 /DNA_START=1 /DNA_END=303 /DNA_ORIENTATION=+
MSSGTIPTTYYMSSGGRKAAAAAAAAKRNRTTGLVVGGCVIVVGMVPLLIRQFQTERMIDSEQPLTGSQVQRGPFLNTGSKDVGRDPEWDLKQGRYTGKQ